MFSFKDISFFLLCKKESIEIHAFSAILSLSFDKKIWSKADFFVFFLSPKVKIWFNHDWLFYVSIKDILLLIMLILFVGILCIANM